MFKVLVSDPISDFGLQQLMNADDVEVIKQTGLSEDELISIIGDFDASACPFSNKSNRTYYGSRRKIESDRSCRGWR